MDLKNCVFPISAVRFGKGSIQYFGSSGILYQQKLGMLRLCCLLRKKIKNRSHQIVNVNLV